MLINNPSMIQSKGFSPEVAAAYSSYFLMVKEVRDWAGRTIRTASSVVFEQLGLAYLGPIDGHDIAAVETALDHARSLARAPRGERRTRRDPGRGAASTGKDGDPEPSRGPREGRSHRDPATARL